MPERQNLPVIPIKNTVLFPNLLMPLNIGRPQSVAAIQSALTNEAKEVVVVTQRDSSVEVPEPADLFPTATKAVIKRSRRNGEHYDILVLGVERVVLGEFTGEEFLRANFRPLPIPEPEEENPEVEALHREVVDLATSVLKYAGLELPVEFTRAIAAETDPLQLIWMLASVLSMDVALEHSLLAVETRGEALRLIHAHLSHEHQILEIREISRPKRRTR